jgi:hypothetical protein
MNKGKGCVFHSFAFGRRIPFLFLLFTRNLLKLRIVGVTSTQNNIVVTILCFLDFTTSLFR